MPHRSIVRIRRNENSTIAANFLICVCLYIFLSIFLHQKFYWYIISFIFIMAAVFSCCYIYIIKQIDQVETVETQRHDTLREIESINAEIDILDNIQHEQHEIITAVPISPTNEQSMQTITVYATPV